MMMMMMMRMMVMMIMMMIMIMMTMVIMVIMMHKFAVLSCEQNIGKGSLKDETHHITNE